MKYAKIVDYIIRPADAEKDAESINAIRLQPEVMKTIASIPSEEIQVTKRYLENSLGKFFVAEITEKSKGVVGFLALMPSEDPYHKHVVYLGIMIHKDYHRCGIGRALMEKAVDVADNMLAAKRIELDVDVSNEGAIRLYESMGFKKEGMLRKTTITRGAYVDDFLMSRLAPDTEFKGRDENISELKDYMAGYGSYIVRPVDVKDAVGLWQLYGELQIPKALEKLQEDLKNPVPHTYRFVAIELETAKICGFASLGVSSIHRMRHRGEVCILVSCEYEPEAISALIDTMVDLADNWLCLVRLEVSIISEDAGIIPVYKKRGFEIEARKEKSVFHNGNYLDEYILGRVK